MSSIEGSGALPIQPNEPRTPQELIEALEAQGFKMHKPSSFGFRPELDRSSAVPTAEAGAPVLNAARGLRARKRGEIALSEGGPDNPKARELADLAFPSETRDFYGLATNGGIEQFDGVIQPDRTQATSGEHAVPNDWPAPELAVGILDDEEDYLPPAA